MAKKEKLPLTICRECQYAELHQWIQNPVIAICPKRGGERFPASTVMRCPLSKPRTEPEVIHHHKDYTEGPIAK